MKKYVIPLLLILVLPLIFQSTPTEILKLKTFDALIKTPEHSGNFMILNITEEDIEREGGYPLPRKRLADIQLEILGKGALGVGWVISFPQADRMGGDEDFARSLGYAPSVLATFETPNNIFPKTTGTVIKGQDTGGISVSGVKENYNAYDKILQGMAIAPVEADQLVRRIPLLLKTPDGWSASFGTQVLKVLTNTPTYIITTNENGIQEIAVRGLPPVKTDSLGRKWISWVDTPQTDLQEMNVNGKFVFVGITANGVMPQVATPVGLLEPHKIQAALSESILIENSPYIPDWALALELLILVTTVILVWFLLIKLGITWGLVLSVLTASVTALGGYYLINKGLLIDVTWTLISQFISGAIAFYLRFREQYKLRLLIKKQFEHYLDPRQVKRLQNNPDLLKLGGETRRCTFLFTDVRGFTNLSEKLPPEQVTEIMNKVLTVQVNCIQAHGGMVDKFIGDACMAIFNAPLELDNHELRAITCAQDIRTGIRLLQKELPEPISIGIGVNTGEAVIGNMGSDTRFDYSAIGDAVNTAARLESATKEVGVDLLIGENTKKSCDFKLKLLDPIKVKGKKDYLKIYTV
jgi:adenylate cyclase|tara:strand:+ start:1581 stop:3326 length:1746 start_codon:yes stop_codon:yes gene_type:complete